MGVGVGGEVLRLDAATQERLLEVVEHLEADMAAQGRALEFVGAGQDSFFRALVMQLGRKGIFPPDFSRKAAAAEGTGVGAGDEG